MNLKAPALAQLGKWSLGDPEPPMGNFEVSCLWRIVVVFRAAFGVVVGSAVSSRIIPSRATSVVRSK